MILTQKTCEIYSMHFKYNELHIVTSFNEYSEGGVVPIF